MHHEQSIFPPKTPAPPIIEAYFHLKNKTLERSVARRFSLRNRPKIVALQANNSLEVFVCLYELNPNHHDSHHNTLFNF